MAKLTLIDRHRVLFDLYRRATGRDDEPQMDLLQNGEHDFFLWCRQQGLTTALNRISEMDDVFEKIYDLTCDVPFIEVNRVTPDRIDAANKAIAEIQLLIAEHERREI